MQLVPQQDSSREELPATETSKQEEKTTTKTCEFFRLGLRRKIYQKKPCQEPPHTMLQPTEPH
jgi:hypothetical protein